MKTWLVLSTIRWWRPLLFLCSPLMLAAGEPPGPPLAFSASTNSEFTFNTGLLRGTLRAAGRSFGLTSVTYLPTGQSLSRSLGLFGLYRVFSDGRRYGAAAWDWPSQAEQLDNGAVSVTCAAAPDRPFALRGLYRWTAPAVLDVEIQVTPTRDLHGFEAFLASYFAPAFTNSMVYVRQGSDGQPGFLAADKAHGDWHMFPRDDAAVSLIRDGRWTLPPNPVAWEIRPRFDRSLAVRRAPANGLTAVLMAPHADCFGIAMPYETEGHYSTYFSLFGCDIPAGRATVARARLQFLEKSDVPAILDCYRSFVAGSVSTRP